VSVTLKPFAHPYWSSCNTEGNIYATSNGPFGSWTTSIRGIEGINLD